MLHNFFARLNSDSLFKIRYWRGVYSRGLRSNILFRMHFKVYLRTLGRNIKAARLKRGLKQVEVYEGCGLTYRHYQSIEAGKVNVTVETLYRLARLYEVRVQDLVKEDI
jgi:DNA-binding XRE family transcriptional regulator